MSLLRGKSNVHSKEKPHDDNDDNDDDDESIKQSKSSAELLFYGYFG